MGDPTRMAADAAGNVYFGSLHSVFKVDPSGTLTRFAGNGRAGNSGDGGPATSAQLNFPMGIAVDAAGNVFVADRDASVVRKIAANGHHPTVAGNGTPGYAGDGGAATGAHSTARSAWPWTPPATSTSPTPATRRCAKCRPTAPFPPCAGNGTRGFAGDGGPARNALLNGPEGVAVDARGQPVHRGHLQRAHPPRGRGRHHYHRGRRGDRRASTAATAVRRRTPALSLPTDVAVDRAGNLYIADFGNSRIRMVANGIITTVAGRTNGAPLMDGEAAVNARLEGPTGVAVDRGGNFYFVEAGIGSGTGLARGDYKVWKVSAAGILTTLAGNGMPSYSGDGSGGDGGATGRRRRRGGGTPAAICTLRTRRISACARDAAARSPRSRATGRAGLQRRGRAAAHCAAQPSARRGGGCAGQLVCGRHGEQSRAEGAARRQPVHHRGQRQRELFRRRRAGDARAA